MGFFIENSGFINRYNIYKLPNSGTGFCTANLALRLKTASNNLKNLWGPLSNAFCTFSSVGIESSNGSCES